MNDREKEHQKQWVDSVITREIHREFYGELALIMVKGKVKQILKKESLKPPI